MIRLRYDTTIGGVRHGTGSLLHLDPAMETELLARGDADTGTGIYSRDPSGKITGLQADGDVIGLQIHPYYHFHGFAGSQFTGDGKFFDLVGINHGERGTSLSDAQMFADPGYISTADPVSGATDSVLRIPAINFDYSAGEKLILWMLGKWTPEGSSMPMIGDGFNTSQRGWQILVRTDGRFQLVLYGAAVAYGGSGVYVPFDGNLHDFGIVIDGQNRKYCHWVDGIIDPNFGSSYIDFYPTSDFDTRTMNTVNIGASSPAPGGTAGIKTATRALVVLRLPATYPVPAIASITTVFQQLRSSPGKLILASAF